MTSRTFTTQEVAAAIGDTTTRRVAGWCERHVLTPIDDSPGTGVARRFDYAEVVKAGIFAAAQDRFGEQFLPHLLWVPLKVLHPHDPRDRVWPRFVAPSGTMPLYIIIDADQPDRTDFWWPTPKEPVATLNDLGRVALVVNVDAVKAKIEANLAK